MASRSLLELIQKEEQQDSKKCICQTCQHPMKPVPVLRHIDHAACHREVHSGMDQIKTQSHQEAGAGIFYIELHAERRRPVADNGFRDTVNSDRVVAEHVLGKTNHSSREQTGNRTAARHGEENRHQQGQIHVPGEGGKAQGDECLYEQCEQRDTDRHRNAEPVDLNLLIRCVSNGHVIGECLGQREAADCFALGQASALTD